MLDHIFMAIVAGAAVVGVGALLVALVSWFGFWGMALWAFLAIGGLMFLIA